MTKSELIEKLVRKQTQLGYRDVELAVKTMLEHMAQTLSGGNASKYVDLVVSHCISARRALVETPNLEIRYRYRPNMCLTSSPARN